MTYNFDIFLTFDIAESVGARNAENFEQIANELQYQTQDLTNTIEQFIH
jgi:hypothetical protein